MEFNNLDRVEKQGDSYFLVSETTGNRIAGPFPNRAAAEREFRRRQGQAKDQERRKRPERGQRTDQNRRKRMEEEK